VAPTLKTNSEAVELILQPSSGPATSRENRSPSAWIPASSGFYEDGLYISARRGARFTAEELVAVYADWMAKYPIVSLEDGLAEDDW
jgi:enolase